MRASRKILGGVLLFIAGVLIVDDLFFGTWERAVRDLVGGGNKGLVARVSGHPISRSQLDRAVDETLWLDGKSAANLTPDELEKFRATALDGLIDRELLRLQVQAANPPPAVSAAEIDVAMLRVGKRFPNKMEMQSALKSQHVGDLRGRIAFRLAGEKYVAQKIASAIAVTEPEARNWFEANAGTLGNPERIAARHIFIPTLDHPPEEAKQKLDAALADLTAKKKDFGTLAREVSEDPATKDSGGELGWMTRDRLPADFSASLFALKSDQPALIRTKLGWHLVEITNRKSAEKREFQKAKDEVWAGLEAEKRQHAVEDFRKSLRAGDRSKIEYF